MQTFQFQETDMQPNFWQKIGLTGSSVTDANASIAGFSVKIINLIAVETATPVQEILNLVEIPTATYSRRRTAAHLKKDESDRVYRFAEVFQAALGLHEGDRDAAMRWLNTEAPSLGGTPLSLVKTNAGARSVLALVDRLDDGVFS